MFVKRPIQWRRLKNRTRKTRAELYEEGRAKAEHLKRTKHMLTKVSEQFYPGQVVYVEVRGRGWAEVKVVSVSDLAVKVRCGKNTLAYSPHALRLEKPDI